MKFSDNMITEKLKNTPFVTQVSPNLIREGGRTVGSGRVACLKPLRQIYVGENEADNPLISPIFGDYTDFPPTFITCDYNETLYADAKALYKKCEQAGVDVELVEMKGTFHAFAPIGTGTPETKQIIEENIAFMQKYL